MSVTRSSDACLCGCKGWCSLYPHLQTAAWQFEAMASGRRPPTQSDGRPWAADDELAGPKEFLYTAVLLWVKGDWNEHAKSLGLAPWSATFNACQFCNASSDEMHTMYDELNPRGPLPFNMRGREDCLGECDRCEVKVQIDTGNNRISLLAKLRVEKGKGLTRPHHP